MSQTELTISLHNGISIPLFGLDTIRYNEAEAYAAVTNALENGIRHIETASDYGTEKIIGQAIHYSPIPRSSLFVTDEINGINNTEAMIRSAEAAIRRLDLDYIDLLLMAWNGGETETDPANENVYKAWKGLEQLYKCGNAHAIGIVDFYPWQIEYLLQNVDIAPMVSYVGLFPGHPDIDKLITNAEHNIQTMAYLPANIQNVINSKEISILAEKHHCTAEEIILQYLKQKSCAIAVRKTIIPDLQILLDEDEMNYLDVMKDYTV